jgi:hypothetical protein
MADDLKQEIDDIINELLETYGETEVEKVKDMIEQSDYINTGFLYDSFNKEISDRLLQFSYADYGWYNSRSGGFPSYLAKGECSFIDELMNTQDLADEIGIRIANLIGENIADKMVEQSGEVWVVTKV